MPNLIFLSLGSNIDPQENLPKAIKLLAQASKVVAISPVWKPGVLIAEEFRLQTILAITTMGLAVIAPILKNISLKILAGVFVVAGVAAILLPIQQFTLTQPGISEAYNQTVHLGWGWWVTVVGIVMAMVGSLIVFLAQKEKSDGN